MAKKGKKVGMTILGVLGAIALIVFILAQTGLIGQSALGGDKEKTPTVSNADCPDTKKAVYFKIFDTDSSSGTTLTNTINIYEKTSGKLIANVTGVSGSYSTGTTLCGDFKAVAVTSAGSAGSAEADFSVRFNDEYVEMRTNQLALLQSKFKFVDTDAYGFIGQDGTYATNTSTAYVTMNSSVVSDVVAGTAKAIGADGKLEGRIFLQSATARKYFGDKALNTYMCVDLGSNNVWDEPIVSVGGVVKANVKTSLKPNDLVYSLVSNSEYCYNLGTPIANAELQIDVKVPTRAGQNPGSSDDVIFAFLPEGKFKSVASATVDQALTGIATDASTQALVGVATSYVPKMQVDIQ